MDHDKLVVSYLQPVRKMIDNIFSSPPQKNEVL